MDSLLLALAVVAFASSVLLSGFALSVLRRIGAVDVPTHRSAHTVIAIRGVGSALTFVFAATAAVASIQLASFDAGIMLLVSATSFAAGVIGLFEDLKGLSMIFRLGSQLLLGTMLGIFMYKFFDLTLWHVFLIAIAVTGIINLANFMDGIDGISSFTAVTSGTAYALFGFLLGLDWLAYAGVFIAVTFAGFLPWNLARAGTFLGDSGSYLLGASLASLFLLSIASGVPFIAAIAPLIVYLFDGGLTLVLGLFRGHSVVVPHRRHLYQRIVDSGQSHVSTALLVAACSALASTGGIVSVVDGPLYAALLCIAASIFLYLFAFAHHTQMFAYTKGR